MLPPLAPAAAPKGIQSAFNYVTVVRLDSRKIAPYFQGVAAALPWIKGTYGGLFGKLLDSFLTKVK
jgi:hypothetical protein